MELLMDLRRKGLGASEGIWVILPPLPGGIFADPPENLLPN
jgi:hypothetical protein